MRKFQLQACDRASAEFKVTWDHMFLCSAGMFYSHFMIGFGLRQTTLSSVKLPISLLLKETLCIFFHLELIVAKRFLLHLTTSNGWNCTNSNDTAHLVRDYVTSLCSGTLHTPTSTLHMSADSSQWVLNDWEEWWNCSRRPEREE